MKLGAQITKTDEQADFAYLVTQLEQAMPAGIYAPTGGLVWVDRSLPDPERRLIEALDLCFAARFSGHRRK